MSSPALVSLHIPTPPVSGFPTLPISGLAGAGRWWTWPALGSYLSSKTPKRVETPGDRVVWALWAVDFIGTFQGCQMFPHGHGFICFVI